MEVSSVDAFENISIHALREEGDGVPPASCKSLLHFYPRPPRGGRLATFLTSCRHSHFYPRPPRGGRRCSRAAQQAQRKFLSTPSARRATSAEWLIAATARDFYPRPPRGGRPHSRRQCRRSNNFYPRPPRGGRRLRSFIEGKRGNISIHALREEGDEVRGDFRVVVRLISIHALREEGDS